MSYTLLADVAAEVEIPRNGTLSRVLHTDDDLRLVAFAFDDGQELTEHSASMPAVVQVVSGGIEVALGGDTVQLTPGSWLHMPAHQPHSVRATEPAVMLLTMLRRGSA